MNLPVADVDAAVPFYEKVLGFRVLSRGEEPQRYAVLGRDDIEMRICENGGDPTQDGCAFHVTGVEELMREFSANGLNKSISDISPEEMDGAMWQVFYVVAPDGLCFWFGEREHS